MIFGLPWRLVAIVGLIVVLFGAAYFFDHEGYKRGVSSERHKWETQLDASERRVQRAEAARDAVIAQAARDRAIRQAQITVLSQRGHDEIAAATPDHESAIDPALVSAWRASLDRLCVYPVDTDGHFAPACGSSASG